MGHQWPRKRMREDLAKKGGTVGKVLAHPPEAETPPPASIAFRWYTHSSTKLTRLV
jgi:hypothetical protein